MEMIPILLSVIGVFTVLLFILTLYLFLQKGRHATFQQNVKTYVKDNERKWYDILIQQKDVQIADIPKKKFEFVGLERIFLMYLKHYQVTSSSFRISQYANNYMTNYYRDLLHEPRWSKKMNALHRVYDFRLVGLLQDCEKINYKELDADMQLQLFKIFARMSPKRLLKILLDEQWTLSEMDYRQIFMSVEDDTFKQLTVRFEELPLQGKTALIETLHTQQKFEYIDWLTNNLQHPVSEVRIRTLKALYQMKYVESIQLFEPFTHSDIWEERMMTAKLMRYFPIEQAHPFLEKLLEDSHYTVRLEASQSFANIKDGENWLQLFLNTSTDQYAIEMVKATLEQKKV